jgi:hypothetical protein
MKRLPWCALLAFLALAWAIAHRTARPSAGPPDERVARSYDVGDLLDLPPDPDEPPPLAEPASRYGPPPANTRVGMHGLFRTPTQRCLDELADQIRVGVAPETWQPGHHSVTPFGRRLIIVQTRENHDLIRSLLDDLRGSPPRQVRVDVVWATLTPAELDALTVPTAPTPVRTVDLAALRRDPARIAFSGQTTCISGRRARVACGRARTAVTEVEAVFDNDHVAAAAHTQRLTDGATVDVIPSLSPDAANVLIDVQAEVSRFAPDDAPPIAVPASVGHGGTAPAPLHVDRLNFGVQIIRTSARGPTNVGLVIGETADPSPPAGADANRRLYLIVSAAEWNPAKNVR